MMFTLTYTYDDEFSDETKTDKDTILVSFQGDEVKVSIGSTIFAQRNEPVSLTDWAEDVRNAIIFGMQRADLAFQEERKRTNDVLAIFQEELDNRDSQ